MAKAPRPFQPVVATGNALRSGDVVFRTVAGEWSRDVAQAQVALDAEAAARLQAATDADVQANLVVDTALIAVAQDGGAIIPVALRERIRAQGPTIELPVDG